MMMTQGFPHKVPPCLALQQTFVKVKIRVKDEIGKEEKNWCLVCVVPSSAKWKRKVKEIKIIQTKKEEASVTCCQMYKEEKKKQKQPNYTHIKRSMKTVEDEF